MEVIVGMPQHNFNVQGTVDITYIKRLSPSVAAPFSRQGWVVCIVSRLHP